MRIDLEKLNGGDGPVVIPLAHGYHVESSAENYLSGEYVTVLNPDGDVVGHWVCDEWREDPVSVMGAIINVIAAIQQGHFINDDNSAS